MIAKTALLYKFSHLFVTWNFNKGLEVVKLRLNRIACSLQYVPSIQTFRVVEARMFYLDVTDAKKRVTTILLLPECVEHEYASLRSDVPS